MERNTRLFTLGAAAFGIYAGARMAWENRGENGVWAAAGPVLLLVTALSLVGLLRGRQWALRLSWLAAVLGWMLGGFMTYFYWGFWLFEEPSTADRIRAVLRPEVILFHLVPILWLIYSTRPRIRRQFTVVFLIFSFLFPGSEVSWGQSLETGSSPEAGSVITANNQLGLDLYSELRKSEEGNLFFSPYSLSAALAMIYEGARGKTEEEMQAVLHVPADPEVRRPAFLAVSDQINQPDTRYQLHTANALWAQAGYSFLEEYLLTLGQYYGGHAVNLDFRKAAGEASFQINQWVEEKTHHKIKNFISADSLSGDTRLVLTNAVYFKGNWVNRFDPEKTQEEDFRVHAAETAKVPMMRQKENMEFRYGEFENLQILEMMYEGERLSMLVLLPKDEDLDALESSLSLENLAQWRDYLWNRAVEVYLPKFTFTAKYTMTETLKNMGMPGAFTPEADLSGMDGTKNLFIDAVIHQAFVDVNEEGTEAAAVTGGFLALESLPSPPPVFRADHPFLFIIQDRQNGNILFLGRVKNPKT